MNRFYVHVTPIVEHIDLGPRELPIARYKIHVDYFAYIYISIPTRVHPGQTRLDQTYKLYKAFLSASSHVAELLPPIGEVFKRWVSSHIVLGAHRRVLGAAAKAISLLLPREFWFCSLAVATPGGIEHDQSMFHLLEEWSEVFISYMYM